MVRGKPSFALPCISRIRVTVMMARLRVRFSVITVRIRVRNSTGIIISDSVSV